MLYHCRQFADMRRLPATSRVPSAGKTGDGGQAEAVHGPPSATEDRILKAVTSPAMGSRPHVAHHADNEYGAAVPPDAPDEDVGRWCRKAAGLVPVWARRKRKDGSSSAPVSAMEGTIYQLLFRLAYNKKPAVLSIELFVVKFLAIQTGSRNNANAHA